MLRLFGILFVVYITCMFSGYETFLAFFIALVYEVYPRLVRAGSIYRKGASLDDVMHRGWGEGWPPTLVYYAVLSTHIPS